MASTQIGTLIYTSPEVIIGYAYSYSCDIWSLGIILYELCLLKNPLIHLKSTQKIISFIIEGDFEELIKKVREKNYSKRTCDLIQQILVKNPNERPTIDKIIKECENILYDLKNKNDYYNNQLLYSFVVFNNQINLGSNNDENKLSQSKRDKKNNNSFRKNLSTIKVKSPYEDYDKYKYEKSIREAIDKINKEGFQVFPMINKNNQFSQSHNKYGESYYIYDNEKLNEKKVDNISGRQIGMALKARDKSFSKKIQDNDYKYSKLLTIGNNTSIELEDNNVQKSKNYIEDKSAAILPMNFTEVNFNPKKEKRYNLIKNNQEEYKNKDGNKNEKPGKKNDDDGEFFLFTYYQN